MVGDDTQALAPAAELTAPHYSTRGVRAFIQWLDIEEGVAAVDAALADAGLPRSYVVAEDLWVSWEWQRRFKRALAARLFQLNELPDHDHPFWQLWRHAGHQAVSRDGIGTLFELVRALGSPRLVYRRFPGMVEHYNKLVAVAVEETGPGLVRVKFEATTEWPLGPDLLWNARGTMERVPCIWGLPPAEVTVVEHSERALVYEVGFKEPHGGVLETGLAALVGGLFGALSMPWLGLSAPVAGASLAVAGVLARRLALLQRDQVRESHDLEQLIAAQDARYQQLWEEERKLRRSLLASQKLSGYLPADLVDEILENPEVETTLGGRRTDAAVLFADLVGFTPRTERRAPEAVVDELNLYFSCIDPAFERHGGIIDKRMGDGVMGVFVPKTAEPAGQLRLRAVRCALELLEGVVAANDKLRARGDEPLAARVGLAAGPLVQGTMGSRVKFEYTVIGDVVNTAARLEGQATPGHVVVQAALFDALPEEAALSCEVVDRRAVRVKGKGDAIAVVELRPSSLAPGRST